MNMKYLFEMEGIELVIRLLDKGTLFDVTALSDTPNASVKMKGALYDTERSVFLLVEGLDLYEYFEGQASGLRVHVLFYHGEKECSFYGRFVRTFVKNSVNLVEIEATSGIEEKTRRSTLRIDLSLPVKIYAQTNSNEKDLVCSGRTADISSDAICILSNDKLNVPKDSRFFVEFTLCKTDQFYLPAKLVRYGDSPQSVQYKHDYVLVFDFSGDEEGKSRLITSFFKNSLEARK